MFCRNLAIGYKDVFIEDTMILNGTVFVYLRKPISFMPKIYSVMNVINVTNVRMYSKCIVNIN